MATFKITLDNGVKGEIKWDRPTSVTDPKWADLVKNPDTDVNELACQKLVVIVQNSGMRKCKTIEAAQAHADNHVYGSGKTPNVKDLGGVAFTQQQIDQLTKDGTILVNYEIIEE